MAAIIIFIGEAVVIYAEIVGAKLFGISNDPFLGVFLKLALIVAMGSWILLIGYMLGQRAFKNIWIVGVISLVSILIMEPVLNYAITRSSGRFDSWRDWLGFRNFLAINFNKKSAPVLLLGADFFC